MFCVVLAQLARLRALNERARQFRQGRTEALESGQYLQGGRPQGGDPVPVTTAEEAAALPPGTLFRTPDGRVIRRGN